MNTHANPVITLDTYHRLDSSILPKKWNSFNFLVSPGSNIDTPSVVIYKEIPLPRSMKGVPTTQEELFWADASPEKFNLPEKFSLNASQSMKDLLLSATFESTVMFAKNGYGVVQSAGVMIVASLESEELLQMNTVELVDFLSETVGKMMIWEYLVPSYA